MDLKNWCCSKKYFNLQHFLLYCIESLLPFFCVLHRGSSTNLDSNSFRSHKSEKNLMCQFCSKAFRKMKVYVRHANSNHQKDVANFWIICPDCRVYFPGKKCHRTIMHGLRVSEYRTSIKVYCPFTC
jgi:hypothetical protein